jgi:rare lipoprotein A
MRSLALCLLLMLAGCDLFERRPVQTLHEDVRFTVGSPYQAGGVVRYPREAYGVDETGLATIAPDYHGLTADGEIFDQTLLAAGHRTLQLPAIVQVTNLENGRQITLRLNDRGPSSPARLIALTKRSAELLDIHHDGTRVRLQMIDAETRQLAASLQASGPTLAVAAAPQGKVEAETLAPPGGAPQSSRVRQAAATPAPANGTAPVVEALPRRLPERIVQFPAAPGRLYIAAGSFSRADYASILVNRLAFLGARLTTSYTASRDSAFQIRIGPFDTVAEAEAMLTRAIQAGVNDAAIVVE